MDMDMDMDMGRAWAERRGTSSRGLQRFASQPARSHAAAADSEQKSSQICIHPMIHPPPPPTQCTLAQLRNSGNSLGN